MNVAMHPLLNRAGNATAPNDTTPSTGDRMKAQILIEATRDFTGISRPSALEIARYKELFYQLAGELETADRQLMSAMLARFPFTPRPVAFRFAQDEIEIAAPFLRSSPVLSEADLMVIADKKGRQYSDIIAHRADTPETASVPVKPEISVSAPSSSERTNGAAQNKAGSEERLFGEDVAAIASVGGKLGREPTAPQNAGSGEKRDSGLISTGLAQTRLPETERRKLMYLARLSDHDGFAERIEALCGLDRAITRELMVKADGDEFLYLIKALGIPKPHDLQLMLLVMPQTGRGIGPYRRARKMLADLDQGICRSIFNQIGANFVNNRFTGGIEKGSTPAPGGYQAAMRARREHLDNLHPAQTGKETRPAMAAAAVG